ncbi:TetR/AcrR family transcriptional regulator [Niveibacterium sp. SC-1]|uniref:TetR/AcrR family transcriptional regulator n=1 Tax=Niveibacterium sp. SC-1 TaxID=3135646 RepID=UPI00311DD361
MSVSQTRADATRRTLLETTGEILASEGYAALSEEHLCARSGVSRGALRYHFPAGRYDLLPAFADSVVARQAQRIEALGELPARQRLYLVLMSMRDMPPSAPTVALLELWMASRGDRKLAELMRPIMDRAMSQMLGGSADPDDAEVLALRIVVHGASMLAFSPDFSTQRLHAAIAWLLERLPPPPELQERLAALNARRAR